MVQKTQIKITLVVWLLLRSSSSITVLKLTLDSPQFSQTTLRIVQLLSVTLTTHYYVEFESFCEPRRYYNKGDYKGLRDELAIVWDALSLPCNYTLLRNFITFIFLYIDITLLLLLILVLILTFTTIYMAPCNSHIQVVWSWIIGHTSFK